MIDSIACDNCVFIQPRTRTGCLQTQPMLSCIAPIHGAPRHHHTADLASEPLLQQRPPRNQLEPEATIDHREPTRREVAALAIQAGDAFAVGGRAMCEAGLSGEF